MAYFLRCYTVWALALLLCLLLCSCSGQKEKHLLVVGDKAPDFKIANIVNSSAVSLADGVVSTHASAGSPMILRFFDPYCKYCKADTVVFNQYYEKYKGRGLQVVYIDTDNDLLKIKEFIKDLDIQFPVVLDLDKKMANLFMVKIIPQTIVLDSNHTIVGALIGGVSQAELDDLLGSYIAE